MIQGPQLPQLALYFVVVLKGARTDATPRLPLSAVLASSVRLGPKANASPNDLTQLQRGSFQILTTEIVAYTSIRI